MAGRWTSRGDVLLRNVVAFGNVFTRNFPAPRRPWALWKFLLCHFSTRELFAYTLVRLLNRRLTRCESSMTLLTSR